MKYRYSSGHRDDHFSDPMQITVYYDEKNPKKAYDESKVSDKAARHDGVILSWLDTLAMEAVTYFVLKAIFM